jgi:hypothetical protein
VVGAAVADMKRQADSTKRWAILGNCISIVTLNVEIEVVGQVIDRCLFNPRSEN